MLQEFAEQEVCCRRRWARRSSGTGCAIRRERRKRSSVPNNDGQACVNFLRERLQDVLQILLGLIQQAKVIKRTAATKMLLRDHHVESRVRKYFQAAWLVSGL